MSVFTNIFNFNTKERIIRLERQVRNLERRVSLLEIEILSKEMPETIKKKTLKKTKEPERVRVCHKHHADYTEHVRALEEAGFKIIEEKKTNKSFVAIMEK